MEFFHDVNIDWMGKAKYFVILSLLLLAVGWFSIIRNGGLRYGIDFRGGNPCVCAVFRGPTPTAAIRKGLDDAGLRNSNIQPISDISDPNSKNDLVVSLEQEGQSDQALDEGKQRVVAVLHKIFGSPGSDKPDFNAISASALAADLTQKDPLGFFTPMQGTVITNAGATARGRARQRSRRRHGQRASIN